MTGVGAKDPPDARGEGGGGRGVRAQGRGLGRASLEHLSSVLVGGPPSLPEAGTEAGTEAGRSAGAGGRRALFPRAAR